jgi:predicted nucleic acid-binding Zn finger protein
VLLERKRNDFPRFYFLSNDELLQVLAGKDPLSVQLHLRKLFENIATISTDMDDIVRIYSAEGEALKVRRVKAVGTPVERWLY